MAVDVVLMPLPAIRAERLEDYAASRGRARDYYPRFGFERGKDLGVDCPFPVPAEAWMVHLLPAYRPQARGTVEYPEAFGL